VEADKAGNMQLKIDDVSKMNTFNCQVAAFDAKIDDYRKPTPVTAKIKVCVGCQTVPATITIDIDIHQ